MRHVYAEDAEFKGTPFVGRDALVNFDKSFFAAFPDYRRDYLQEIVGDGAVAFTWHMTATHTGRFMELEPTGRRMDAEGCTVLTIRDGFVRGQAFRRT
jgi:predicted ester cyclase